MQETKKIGLADKKLSKALSTFENAVAEIDQAITLKQDSVSEDERQLVTIKGQIKALQETHRTIEASIEIKQREIARHVSVAEKLKEFTI